MPAVTQKLRQAAKILEHLMTSKEFADFLTLASYDYIGLTT